jgi:arylformamidase
MSAEAQSMAAAGAGTYRGMDRAALDRQYELARTVADLEAYIARWQRESAAARAALPCELDVPYGPTRDERLDVFAAGERAPVVVFVHGGYWRRLHKDDCSYVAPAYAAAGATTVVPNYALCPNVTITEIVRQIRAALAWVHDRIGGFGGDPERIYVVGHSAGAHLAAMALLTDWPGDYDRPADLVKGVAAISGIFDLEPIRLCFLNEVLGLTEDEARWMSPIGERPTGDPALLVAVGALETEEFKRQSEEYLAAAGRGTGLILRGQNHFDTADRLAQPSTPLARAIFSAFGLPGA